MTLLPSLLSGIAGFVLGIVLTVGGGIALAHGGGHPMGKHRWSPEKMEARFVEIAEQLDLTPEQEGQIRSILEEAKAQLQTVREQSWGREKFTAFRQLHFDTEDRIHEVLSCEQKDELRTLRRAHRAEKMKARFDKHAERDQN